MEPERKIEKLLRAFAKKRREDAGDFKLHPAARRLLQNEVSRRAPQPRKGDFLGKMFGVLRPGFVYATCIAVMICMGAALLLPALSKSKSRSVMAGASSNLKQIGIATREFADKNNQQLPQSLADIRPLIGTNLLLDPASGKPFVYVAGGRSVDSLRGDSVLAYSPDGERNRAVLFADGHVENVSRARFAEITNRGLIQFAVASVPARREIAETSALAGTPNSSVVVAGDQSKLADVPMTLAVATGTDLENAKIQNSEDRKKLVAEGTLATGVATRTAAVSRPPVAAPGTANPSLKIEASASSELAPNSTLTAALSGKTPVMVTQQFTQTANKQNAQNIFKNASAAAKATSVLANFQFQQNGSSVAVVDEDGSVYNGYLVASVTEKIQNAPSESKRAPIKATVPAQKIPADSLTKDVPASKVMEPAENYFFQVSGTNRSLQQSVVFNGTVVVFSNSAQAAPQTFSGNFNRVGGSNGGNASPALEKNMSQQLGLFSNARISGTAVVNSTNEIEINALPVAP